LLLPVLTSIVSFKVEREQVLEYLFVREVRGPAVGREDCPIKPGGTKYLSKTKRVLAKVAPESAIGAPLGEFRRAVFSSVFH
jgi:hypothetical protein